MNRAVSTWKKLFFKSNIRKIRKAIIDYLEEEGIKVKLENGLLVVELDEYYYSIDFNLDGEYPQCEIMFKLKHEVYGALEISQKTFIADKVNTDADRHSVVKAFFESLVIETHFYFCNRKMLLSLFHDYFIDLKETVDETTDWLSDAIEENKNQRRPIGFITPASSNKNSNEEQPAAQNESNVK